MTTKEAAALLGITVDRVNQLCNTKKLAFTKKDGRRIFTEQAISRYQAARGPKQGGRPKKEVAR